MMKTQKARTGNLLGWKLSRQPTLAELSHVAPPTAYLLETALGKPFSRTARYGSRRPRDLFFRRALCQGHRTVHRRLVSGPTPGLVWPRPAQTPRRVLQGSRRQVRCPPRTETTR